MADLTKEEKAENSAAAKRSEENTARGLSQNAKVVDLFNSGSSVIEIAIDMGMNPIRVQNKLRAAGIDYRDHQETKSIKEKQDDKN